MAVTALLFLLVVGTFTSIVRDVWPLLNAENQAALRDSFSGAGGIRAWRRRDRAIDTAWNLHVRSFPKSHKRILFAIFLVVALLSIVAYPVWQAFFGR
jgi:hypothetical protein